MPISKNRLEISNSFASIRDKSGSSAKNISKVWKFNRIDVWILIEMDTVLACLC